MIDAEVLPMSKKYINHYQSQINHILETTQDLCVEKGIESVSIVDIAKGCNITRATIYNYFSSKEDILWAIFFSHQAKIYQKSQESLPKHSTTYLKLKAYANAMFSLYKEDIHYPIFMELFGSMYMAASSKKDFQWKNTYNQHNIKPGDMVKQICENFHDGSIKPDLDPHQTTVSFIYAVSGLFGFMYKANNALVNKYSLNYEQVIKIQIDWLLEGIKQPTV